MTDTLASRINEKGIAMTETKLDIRRVGYYSSPQTADREDCTQCHNADWADILLEGICGKCLLANSVAAEERIEELEKILMHVSDEARHNELCPADETPGEYCSCFLGKARDALESHS